MKNIKISIILIAIFITLSAIVLFTERNAQPIPLPIDVGRTSKPKPKTSLCDESLWNHVYTGDPRKFSKPQDRLKVIQDCVQVTGRIETAIKEKDGDYHIRLKLDPQYASMLNAKNISGQHGDLVLEPVCENHVTQRDTLDEQSCVGYTGHIFSPTMIGRNVVVVGAYVTDMEHGWNEIHPVTSITIQEPLNFGGK